MPSRLIETILGNPCFGEATPTAKQQITHWLADIENIDHLNHLEEIIRACDRLWNVQHHQHFTTHGLLHSGRIVVRLADWLAANQPPTLDILKPKEAFILLGAAFLHDIGMQCMSPEFLISKGIHFDSKGFAVPPYDSLEVIRQYHPCFSEDMIQDACKPPGEREYPQFRLDASSFPYEAQLMAKVSLYHVGPLSAVPKEIRENERSYAIDSPVRLMLLIPLLRVGDALDADASRLNTAFLESRPFASLPAKEQFHTLKHAYTASIVRRDKGKFTFYYTLPTDARDLSKAISRVSEQYMREHCEIAGKLLDRFGISLDSVESHNEDTSNDWICPYPLTPEARAEFLAVLSPSPRSGEDTPLPVQESTPQPPIGPPPPPVKPLPCGPGEGFEPDCNEIIRRLNALRSKTFDPLLKYFPESASYVPRKHRKDLAADLYRWAFHVQRIADLIERLEKAEKEDKRGCTLKIVAGFSLLAVIVLFWGISGRRMYMKPGPPELSSLLPTNPIIVISFPPISPTNAVADVIIPESAQSSSATATNLPARAPPETSSIRILVSPLATAAEFYLGDDRLGPVGEIVTGLLASATNALTVRAPGFEPLTTNVFANTTNLGAHEAVLCPAGFVPLPDMAGTLAAVQLVAASNWLLPVAIEHQTTGMQFVLIPTGILTRVANTNVTNIPGPIYVAVTELSREQWAKGMTGKAIGSSDGCLPATNTVVQIKAFCQNLNQETGRFRFAIPDEYVWEYAARAGRTNAVEYGSLSNLSSEAWWFNNSESGPHPVGIHDTNAWGLCDVLGNMDELCSNLRPDGMRYVAKGGRFSSYSDECRFETGRPVLEEGSERLGVRLVLMLEPSLERNQRK